MDLADDYNVHKELDHAIRVIETLRDQLKAREDLLRKVCQWAGGGRGGYHEDLGAQHTLPRHVLVDVPGLREWWEANRE